MSDRMPEDLPVRKCINAMVGIIRSEVIFVKPVPSNDVWCKLQVIINNIGKHSVHVQSYVNMFDLKTIYCTSDHISIFHIINIAKMSLYGIFT